MDQQVDHIALEIRGKMAQAPNPPPTYTIRRFPEFLVKTEDPILQPRLASFGPYHSRNRDLIRFNDYKHQLVFRREGLGSYLLPIREEFIQQTVNIKSCYSENIFNDLHIEDLELVDMMFLDGSFMLELFLGYDQGRLDWPWSDQTSVRTSVQTLIADLLNLENQLPFFILQRLFHLFNPKEKIDTLPNLALRFLNQAIGGPMANSQNQEPVHLNQEPMHLLDLFRRSLLPSNNPDPQQSNHDSWMDSIPRVKDLWSAGVHLLDLFRRSLLPSINPDPQQSNHDSCMHSIQRVKYLRSAGITVRQKTARSLLEIDFRKFHIPPLALKIPPFAIDDLNKAILVNCVAMELYFRDQSQHFTAYVCFMSCLIQQPEDVVCLRSVDIIRGYSQDEKCFIDMLYGIGTNVSYTLRECYLWKQFREIQSYYNSCWASIRRTLLAFNNIMLYCSLLQIAIGILSWRFSGK